MYSTGGGKEYNTNIYTMVKGKEARETAILGARPLREESSLKNGGWLGGVVPLKKWTSQITKNFPWLWESSSIIPGISED